MCPLTVLPPRLVQNLQETYCGVEVAISAIIIHLYSMQLLSMLLNSLEVKLKLRDFCGLVFIFFFFHLKFLFLFPASL